MSKPAVLVTRPQQQAAALCAQLQLAGFIPVVCPLLEIEAIEQPDAEARQLLLALDNFQHLIFVSSNAVRLGMQWIENYWPQLPAGQYWYTVGEASARELEGYGLKVLRPGQGMTSEELLALPSLQSIAGDKVLIVKGEGGRDTLRKTLAARGARVELLSAYRRLCPAMAAGELAAAIQASDCQAVLLSSGEGLHNMVSLLSDKELQQLQALAVIVPGARVAAMAREAGFQRVIQAANASDEAMTAACSELLHSGVEGGR
jgi:uroporphyrinogen-III synthase